MAFNGIYITDLGKNLLAKALTGKTLNFTKIKLGDGALTSQDISAMTNLINVVKTLDITKLKVNTNTGEATIETYFSNQTVTTGFYMREIGVYATDPDIGEILYMYGNAGSSAEYIPAYSASTIIERNMSIVASISNATTITATLASNIYAKSSDLIGTNIAISDAGNYYTGANTEIILQEIGAKMEQKADKLGKELPTLDLNSLITTGNYWCGDFSIVFNIPTGANNSYGTVTVDNCGLYIIQYLFVGGSSLYTRFSPNGTTWYEWKQISTTDKIDISSTLAVGWQIYANDWIGFQITKSGGYCNINANIKNTSIINTDVTIANISDVNYKPIKRMPLKLKTYNSSTMYNLAIYPDGTIRTTEQIPIIGGSFYYIDGGYPTL